MMEQLLLGMRTAASEKDGKHFAVEIAVDNKSHDIIYYVAVLTSLLPCSASAIHFSACSYHSTTSRLQYFLRGRSYSGSKADLQKHPIYPLKTHSEFATDPLLVVLNAFSKIEKEEKERQYNLQSDIRNTIIVPNYETIIRDVEKGMRPKDAIQRSTLVGGFTHAFKDVFVSPEKDREKRY